MVRIFTANHGTQLLVIQHLRRHLKLPEAREFLVWNPLENLPWLDAFMQDVLSTAGFVDTLDIRNFESLRPRVEEPAAWWFEFARRFRRDAATVHAWMKKNGISENEVELWADDPFHFNVIFLRSLLRKAHQVKFPHCFNLEDMNAASLKEKLTSRWRDASWTKRLGFWPWLRWTSGVDLRLERCVYDRAYTFDRPSCWADDSRDVSNLISLRAFDETYQTLPNSVRKEVEGMLRPIHGSRRPLVVLLLFGLDPAFRQVYQNAISRIFAERRSELEHCTLAVKVHPGARGIEEELLFDWLRNKVPAYIFPIRSVLNLEFMLPRLRPDYVWAGPCGALPVVKRLQVGQPVVLPEIMAFGEVSAQERQGHLNTVDGIEAW